MKLFDVVLRLIDKGGLDDGNLYCKKELKRNPEDQGNMIVEEMRELLNGRGLLKEVTEIPGEGEIRWLTCDSRKVIPGAVFICKGAAFCSEYLQEAADKGCIAYISETAYETKQKLPGMIVRDIRKAMAAASAAFFGYRPGRPVVTGITGTKGKTTTAWYLKAMLDLWQRDLRGAEGSGERAGRETGLLSTIRNYDGEKWEDAVMTTPEAPTLHEFLARADENGLSYVTMEVSSQALKYKRVRELQFEVGIFLNISEDHISPREHEDFEDYFSSKLSMFRQTKTACINLDCDQADRVLRAARKANRIVTFGRGAEADLRCSDIRAGGEKIRFRVTCDRFSQEFELAMKGKFNVENAMAAIAAAYVYGVPAQYMKRALAQTRVPGRMETFFSRDRKICGIVDFAHNRLSFEKLFDAAFAEYSGYSRIITVFGCPGGKALNRRRELGIIAGLFSDYVFITSDDPGMECPGDIAQEVRQYVEMTGCVSECIEEREEAVRLAVRLAGKNSGRTLILLLGRGSEKFQQIGGKSWAYPTDSSLMRQEMERYDREAGACIMAAGYGRAS